MVVRGAKDEVSDDPSGRAPPQIQRSFGANCTIYHFGKQRTKGANGNNGKDRGLLPRMCAIECMFIYGWRRHYLDRPRQSCCKSVEVRRVKIVRTTELRRSLCTWLRECSRQAEAEVVSNSSKELHQTMYEDFFSPLYYQVG